MDKKRAAEEAILMEQVEKLRDELRIENHVRKVLDGLTPQEQLEFLREAEKSVVKKTIPALPEERKDAPKERKSIGTII